MCATSASVFAHTFLRSIRFQRLQLLQCLRLRRIQDNHDNDFDGRDLQSQEALLQLHHHCSHRQTLRCLLPMVGIHHNLQVLRQV